MAERTRTSPARRGIAALVALAVAAVLGAPGATPVAAQARLVNALVHTFPNRPAPGDSVTVVVDVTGCPRGPVTVELFLTTDDGATQDATLVARAAALTNLIRRTHAVLTLPDAIPGWYGARVLCGTFRPPEVAMANTQFAVGAGVVNIPTLGAEAVETAGTVAISGTACPGASVEYDMSAAARWSGAFDAEGTIAVGPDGSWSGEMTVPTDLPPGPTRVRVRCVVPDRFEDDVYVYSTDAEVRIVRPDGA